MELNELAKALCKAQAVIQSAIKDTSNPFYNSKYADLASVWDAARKPLTDNGLCVSQVVVSIDGKNYLRTMLIHTSGQHTSSDIPLMLQKQDMQGLGSAITYARRFGLASIAGISQEDDDGNATTNKAGTQNNHRTNTTNANLHDRMPSGFEPNQKTNQTQPQEFNAGDAVKKIQAAQVKGRQNPPVKESYKFPDERGDKPPENLFSNFDKNFNQSPVLTDDDIPF